MSKLLTVTLALMSIKLMVYPPSRALASLITNVAKAEQTRTVR